MRIPALILAAALLAAPAGPALATVPLPPLLAPDLAEQRDLAKRPPPPAPAPAPVEAPRSSTSNDWSKPEAYPSPQTKAAKAGGAKAATTAETAPTSKDLAPMRAAWQAYQAAISRRDARGVAHAWTPKVGAKVAEDLRPGNPELAENWTGERAQLLTGMKFVKAYTQAAAPGSDLAAEAAYSGIKVRPGDGTMFGELVVEGVHAVETEHFSKGAYTRVSVRMWRVGGRWRIDSLAHGL